MQIPDADYIRDAEMNGMPSPDPVDCPVCGERCETIYLNCYRDVLGCDRCIKTKEAYLWAEEDRNT